VVLLTGVSAPLSRWLEEARQSPDVPGRLFLVGSAEWRRELGAHELELAHGPGIALDRVEELEAQDGRPGTDASELLGTLTRSVSLIRGV